MWNLLKEKIECYAPKAKRYKLAKEYAMILVRNVECRLKWSEFINEKTCARHRELALLNGDPTWEVYSKKKTGILVPILHSAFNLIERFSYEIWCASDEGRAAIQKVQDEQREIAKRKKKRLEALKYAAVVGMAYR